MPIVNHFILKVLDQNVARAPGALAKCYIGSQVTSANVYPFHKTKNYCLVIYNYFTFQISNSYSTSYSLPISLLLVTTGGLVSGTGPI